MIPYISFSFSPVLVAGADVFHTLRLTSLDVLVASVYLCTIKCCDQLFHIDKLLNNCAYSILDFRLSPFILTLTDRGRE